MSNLCIIPARGGSKRIPKKNIKNFLGNPIISYSIEAAIKSKLFTEVMVSTDNQEIVEISRKYGAKVPFLRSKKNSDDIATTYEVIEEVLQKYQIEQKTTFENICCLYPCAPFVTENKLKQAFNELVNKQLDSIFPIIEYSFPIQRALKLYNNKIKLFNDKYLNSRSQDLKKSYDAGQFYWMNIEKILEKKKIITDNCGGLIISELEGQDIDTEIDWKLAELKFKMLKN